MARAFHDGGGVAWLTVVMVAAALVGADAKSARCPIAPAAEIHYAPEEDLDAIDERVIYEADATIDMAAYVLTDRTIIAALAAAAERGVKVRIWRDGGMPARYEYGDPAAGLAQAAGLAMRTKPRGELMHLKGYCIDDATLRSGSANFSRSGETRQDNDLILVRGAGACDGFEAKFAKDWGGTK